MSWIYNEGKFYMNGSGTGIFYIERNPCRCCPDTYFVEYKAPITGKKTVRFDILDGNIKRIFKQYQLKELK